MDNYVDLKEWETEPNMHVFDVKAPSWVRTKSHHKKRIDKKWKKLHSYVLREVSAHCVVYRHPEMKHLCGYVGLPKNHKLYKSDGWKMDHVEVHGGITFSNFWKKREGFKPDYWYIGFDAGHYMDYVPGLVETLEGIGGSTSFFNDNVYRNMAYMTEETMELAKQLLSYSNLLPYPMGEGELEKWIKLVREL